MSNSSRYRKQRQRDFEGRVAFDPSTVLTHRQGGWRYIPIFPFADEPATGSASPEKREENDAYWELNGDVYFVEVWPTHTDRLDRRGTFFRVDYYGLKHCHVIIVTDGGPLTRGRFEEFLMNVERRIPSRRRLQRLRRMAKPDSFKSESA